MFPLGENSFVVVAASEAAVLGPNLPVTLAEIDTQLDWYIWAQVQLPPHDLRSSKGKN